MTLLRPAALAASLALSSSPPRWTGRRQPAPRRTERSRAARARCSRPTTSGTPTSRRCRSTAQRPVAVPHVSGQPAAPRLRSVVRRATGAVRHPHGRRARASAGHVHFTYSSESDNGAIRWSRTASRRSGGPADGDRHALIVDRRPAGSSSCTTSSQRRKWTAGSGATWKLTDEQAAPAGWTSADAAGLTDPARPAALSTRCGPVASTTRSGSRPTSPTVAHWPARHEPARSTTTSYPPMGARFAQGLVPDLVLPHGHPPWSARDEALRPRARRQRLAGSSRARGQGLAQRPARRAQDDPGVRVPSR